ncbi:hypothetical protein HJG60_007968 [Phyllostomus discolor]|uniref:Uncharacterized protein n=1 Tax=Phyllostomus discolor TaxID=89673 RepID=A0A834BDG9_9CHIR|nr:hypothetical protein HJG60_007968 [Phyllostomus discolor]
MALPIQLVCETLLHASLFFNKDEIYSTLGPHLSLHQEQLASRFTVLRGKNKCLEEQTLPPVCPMAWSNSHSLPLSLTFTWKLLTKSRNKPRVREHQVQIIIIIIKNCEHAIYSEANEGKFSAPSSLFHTLFNVSEHPLNCIPEKGDISGAPKEGGTAISPITFPTWCQECPVYC